MKTLLSFFAVPRPLILLAWILSGSAAFGASDSPTPDSDAFVRIPTELRIKNAQILNDNAPGKSTKATLSNVLSILHPLYPASNITMIGVDNVVIDNLLLELKPHQSNSDSHPVYPPLHSILIALSEATGRQFTISEEAEDKDGYNFVLKTNSSDRVFGVYNFTHYLEPGRPEQEAQLRNLEAEKIVQSSRLAPNNPDMIALDARIGAIAAQISQPGEKKIHAILDQFMALTNETLHELDPHAKMPEYNFHSGSNVMVVIGSRTARDVAQNVFVALDSTPQ